MKSGFDGEVLCGIPLDEAANRTAGYSGDALAGGLGGRPALTAAAVNHHRFSHAAGHNNNRQPHGRKGECRGQSQNKDTMMCVAGHALHNAIEAESVPGEDRKMMFLASVPTACVYRREVVLIVRTHPKSLSYEERDLSNLCLILPYTC